MKRRTFLSSLVAFAAAPLALLRSRKTPVVRWMSFNQLGFARNVQPTPWIESEFERWYQAAIDELESELHRLPSPGDVTLGPRDAVYTDARSTT